MEFMWICIRFSIVYHAIKASCGSLIAPYHDLYKYPSAACQVLKESIQVRHIDCRIKILVIYKYGSD